MVAQFAIDKGYGRIWILERKDGGLRKTPGVLTSYGSHEQQDLQRVTVIAGNIDRLED